MDKIITIDLAKLIRREKRMLLKLSKKSLNCKKDKNLIYDADKIINIDLSKLSKKEKETLFELSIKKLVRKIDKHVVFNTSTLYFYKIKKEIKYMDSTDFAVDYSKPYDKDNYRQLQKINFENISEKENKQIVEKEMEGYKKVMSPHEKPQTDYLTFGIE